MRKLHQKGSLLFFSPPYSQETYFIVCCCVKSLSSCQSLSGSLAENSSAFSPDRWAHRLSSAGGRCLWGGLCLSLAARREELEGRTHMMDHTAQSSHEGPGQSKPIRVSPTCSTDSAPTQEFMKKKSSGGGVHAVRPSRGQLPLCGMGGIPVAPENHMCQGHPAVPCW